MIGSNKQTNKYTSILILSLARKLFDFCKKLLAIFLIYVHVNIVGRSLCWDSKHLVAISGLIFCHTVKKQMTYVLLHFLQIRKKPKKIMDQLGPQITVSQANTNFESFFLKSLGWPCLHGQFLVSAGSLSYQNPTGGLLGPSMLATFLVILLLLSSNQQKSILLKLWVPMFFSSVSLPFYLSRIFSPEHTFGITLGLPEKSKIRFLS